MTSLGWYIREINGSYTVRTAQNVTTIDQAIGVGGSSEGGKQSP